MSIIDTLLGAGGTLTIVSTGGLVARQWLRNRKHARANAAMVERTDREADAQEHVADVAAQAAVTVEALRQVPKLIENVRQLMDDKDECKEALRQSAADRERERREDSEACRRETERQVREALAKRDADITQRIEVAAERIVRKSPTPPEPMPVHPDPHSALSGRREIPPPRRGKETDR